MDYVDFFDNFYDKFVEERQVSAQGLFERFKGPMLARVVDTNDPLNMHRLRIRIPELHDNDLKVDDCPWARPAFWMGGTQAGSWTSFMINDIIYVIFDENHPYNPIYISGGDPTRRARYVLDSVYTKSPIVLSEDGRQEEVFGNYERDGSGRIMVAGGEPQKVEPDYVEDWLPRDRRPMSSGMKDRYGNAFFMKAVGYYPKDHEVKPSVNGIDPLTANQLENNNNNPKNNEPDTKYIGSLSKYGNFSLWSDVGYLWLNEFKGNWDNDLSERKFERLRTNYFTKVFTEERYKQRDQRRTETRTRYGHMIEMRDVGWNQSRQLEWDRKSNKIGENKVPYGSGYGDVRAVDHRWIKLRTKGGHLFQMYDKGFDQNSDNFVKRKLEENEFGEFMDQESPSDIGEQSLYGPGFWHDRKDARFVRIVTRYGFKFVLDDRGTDRTKAEEEDDIYGNGLLIKGRRKGQDHEPRGFGIEFNEKDKLNHMMFYSPKSSAIEINDKYDYLMMGTMPVVLNYAGLWNMSEKWQARGDNEFSTKCMMASLDQMSLRLNPEFYRHHLKLDHRNNYIRFKTHAFSQNGYGVCAGVESRCGPIGGNWTELVDHSDRGIYMTGKPKQGRIVFRSEGFQGPQTQEPTHWVGFDEQPGKVYFMNNGTSKGGAPGKTLIYTKGDIEIIAVDGNISFKCTGDFNVDAGGQIRMKSEENTNIEASAMIIDAGTGHALDGDGIKTQGDMYCTQYHGYKIGCMPGPGASSPSPGGGGAEEPPFICRPDNPLPTYKPDPYGVQRAKDDNSYQSIDKATDIWGE